MILTEFALSAKLVMCGFVYSLPDLPKYRLILDLGLNVNNRSDNRITVSDHLKVEHYPHWRKKETILFEPSDTSQQYNYNGANDVAGWLAG